MTPTQTKILAHLIDIATGVKWNIPPQKATAWEQAHVYAAIYPEELAEMPQMLTAAMLLLKSESKV